MLTNPAERHFFIATEGHGKKFEWVLVVSAFAVDAVAILSVIIRFEQLASSEPLQQVIDKLTFGRL